MVVTYSLLGLLVLPLCSKGLHVKVALFCFCNDSIGFANNRSINHLPIERPGSPPSGGGLGIGNGDPHSPLDLVGAGGEHALGRLDLAGVDALLPVEAQGLPVGALLLEPPEALAPPVLGADQVDGAGQLGGAGSGDDGGAGVQELGEGRGAGEGQVEGEVLGGEDEAAQVGRGAADGGEVHDGAGRLDEGDDAHGVGRVVGGGVAVGRDVAEDVGDEGQVGGGVYLGDDEGVEAGEGREGGQVGEGVGGRDGVDAHRKLGDGGRAGGEGGEVGMEVGAGGGLEGWGDGVFEVVGDVVGAEGQGLAEHLLGRAGDWRLGD